MGKGDKKTKKGKIVKGTYGVRRPKKRTSVFIPVEAKPKATKKATKKAVKPKAAAKKPKAAKEKEKK